MTPILTQYINDCHKIPLLTPDEEKHYSRLARQGDECGRQRMIESNLRLVIKIATKYKHSGMPLLDLIEEGNLGLIHAVEKFDPEKGWRFSTYAHWWIDQAIGRSIMNDSRTIRLPVHMGQKLNTLKRISKQLTQTLGREPTYEEIAESSDQSASEVKKLLGYNTLVFSADAYDGEDDKPFMETLIDNNSQCPTDYVASHQTRTLILNWLSELNEKQRIVIERRFGIHGKNECTLEEVGNELGITRERVRQIQLEATSKLRQISKRNGVDKELKLSPEDAAA